MKRNNIFPEWLILAGLLLVLALPLLSASLGTYKQDDCVDVKTILNATAVNISTINYPNSSVAVSNQEMTQTGYTFNYTFCDTNLLGNYVYDYFDDSGNVYVNDFDITHNGKPEASGSIIVLFSILFIIIAGIICYLAIFSLGHLLNLDFDILDFAYDFGIYIIIIVFYYLETFYVGNYVMDSFLLILVQFGWIFFILIPSVALILSLTIGTLNKKKMNVQIPQGRRRRLI